MEELEEKISQLKAIINSFPNSQIIDDCYFELAITLAKSENFEKALNNYNLIIEKFPKSTFVPRAILNKALILYNKGDLINSETLLNSSLSKPDFVPSLSIDVKRISPAPSF